MQFEAIVHAPKLETGARLNVAEVDQTEETPFHSMSAGDGVRLRFGVCCPALSRATVLRRETADRAELEVDGHTWTLRRGAGGIQTPGLVSEDWFVAEPLSN